MKKIEEFIKEIQGSAELQAVLNAIKDKEALATFLKEQNVDGTVEQFAEAVKAVAGAEGELSDEAAENVAGGDFVGFVKWLFGHG
ncbi:MAG: hypothetical protein IKH90_00500 [Ruminococcus sp.]|nr:hypothetical protein [Lachnospiraceae bacterium]MBR7007102.1 hypothetical protein [Ruminococcus sp.]